MQKTVYFFKSNKETSLICIGGLLVALFFFSWGGIRIAHEVRFNDGYILVNAKVQRIRGSMLILRTVSVQYSVNGIDYFGSKDFLFWDASFGRSEIIKVRTLADNPSAFSLDLNLGKRISPNVFFILFGGLLLLIISLAFHEMKRRYLLDNPINRA